MFSIENFIAETISVPANWSGRIDFALGRQLSVFAVEQLEVAKRDMKLE